MINGAHVILYSIDAEADRVFIRDVLGCAGGDAGDGWLIFKLPLGATSATSHTSGKKEPVTLTAKPELAATASNGKA